MIPPPTGIGMPPNAIAAPMTLVINALLASSGPNPLWSAHGARSDFVTSELKVRSSHGAAGSNISAPCAIRPRVPNLFRAVFAKLSDVVRQKSAPSTPNARSIFPPKSCIICDQFAPSPSRSISCAVAAGSVERIAEPSLQTTPVGVVVFLYSSPRLSKSSFSSAYAGPPTKSGCQLDNNSWV